MTVVLLVLAGIGTGLAGSVAGLASLVGYPALLATGLSPVTANVTNTFALVFNTVGSVSGSRPELTGQRHRLRRLVPLGVAGGVVGGLLVLLTPPSAFAAVVPVLIGVSSLGVLVQRRPRATPVVGTSVVASPSGTGPATVGAGDARWLVPTVFGVGVYGGYFGAAAGVLLLATVLAATGETLPRANAVKNVVLGGANAVAAVAFAIGGHPAWSSALPLAAGCLVGSRAGPWVVRRTPAGVLRTVIALAGLGLAVHLGLDTYR